MKTTKIQFNATSFKATRDILSAYFGVLHDLSIELDIARKSTSALNAVINTDRAELSALAMGHNEINGVRICRTMEEIRTSLNTNVSSYNAKMASYNAMYEKTEKARNDAIGLFNNKDSALYKAYSAYVIEPSDENYDAYATAMSARLVELGLKDATVDNVAHYMVNADRYRRGSSAVKSGKIVDALAPKAFSEAILRKFYDNNKSAFASAKFAEYVRKCAEKAKASK